MTEEKSPPYRLFDGQAVGIGTFFASTLCGTILITINHYKLGQKSRGNQVLAIGTAFSILYFVIAFVSPASTTSLLGAINSVLAFCVVRFTDARFRQEFEDHRNGGGVVGMRGIAAGLGVIFLILMFGLIMVYVIVLDNGRTCVTNKGSKERVCYESPYTEGDGQCAVDVLVTLAFFDGSRESDVFLEEEGGNPILSFVVQPVAWKTTEHHDAFENTRLQIQNSCFTGKSVELKLIDYQMEEKLVFPK